MIEKINDNLYKLSEWEYLKKGKGGYRIVYPVKKDVSKPFEKDNIIWKNFVLGGNWLNFVFTLLFFIIIIFGIWSYNHDIESCYESFGGQYIVGGVPITIDPVDSFISENGTKDEYSLPVPT